MPTKDEMHDIEMKVVGIDSKLDAVLDRLGAMIAQNLRTEERAVEAERRAEEAERKGR